MTLSRRRFLEAVTATGAMTFLGCTGSRREVRGSIVGGPSAVGHLLREGSFPPVSHEERASICIVGGGIAGLSAAWELRRRGVDDFVLLELYEECGGNAIFGESPVAPYPWGAHYIPVASKESVLVRELFMDLGVITGDVNGTPVYAEEFLCAEPEERLFRLGRWSPGLIPSEPLTHKEREELARLTALMDEYRDAIGADGRPAFSVPLEESSRDPRFTRLDGESFAAFLDRQGLTTTPLRWYVDYCCRDDYGAAAGDVSAWAGIHYFASRRGWSYNASSHDVVTWPEGNGWIVRKLSSRFASNIRRNSLAYRVTPGERPVVDYFDVQEKRSVRLRTDAVILAAPRFVSAKLLGDRDEAARSASISYRPWMVANIFLDSPPDGTDATLAWDNVIYGSDSPGYVVATHQQHRSSTGRTVLTYYQPLSDGDPDTARAFLHRTSWEQWCERIVADLSLPHPSIRDRIERIDVWRWGHGMVSPQPGYVWSEMRRKLAEPLDHVWFAHSDLSGLSLFEEAQYRGVDAARAVLGVVGGAA